MFPKKISHFYNWVGLRTHDVPFASYLNERKKKSSNGFYTFSLRLKIIKRDFKQILRLNVPMKLSILINDTSTVLGII